LRINEIIIPFEIEEKLLLKHDVESFEVEEIFENFPHIRYFKKGKTKGENLYLAWGQTFNGRYLLVFFIYKLNKNALVISSRDMTLKERKSYGKFKK